MKTIPLYYLAGNLYMIHWGLHGITFVVFAFIMMVAWLVAYIGEEKVSSKKQIEQNLKELNETEN